MIDLGPYANYRLTVRLELINRPGMFAKVADLLAEEDANLGSVDLVSAGHDKLVRDITFDVHNEEHGQRILKRLADLPDVHVISASDPIFVAHRGGKIHVQGTLPLTGRNVLSTVYTPGVGRVSQAIARDKSKVYAYTTKGNSVAIVTDGSAVLGLGNLGAEAALPVMEGKSMLFKEFAGIDAWPICLGTQDPEGIIRAVQAIAPGFGGINLEDISAPRCFEIERRLKHELDIPVMHDDQHGTAAVILAALKNSMKVTKKRLDTIRVVVNGLGAAGQACCTMLLAAGIAHLIGCGRKGIILSGEPAHLHANRRDLGKIIHEDNPTGTLQDALKGADVFIGLSVGNILRPQDLELMAADRIVFAMANPDPEIAPEAARSHCRVFATGRSDYPNQINNVLAFPGIFRGALDVQARDINEAMLLATADAIAAMIPVTTVCEDYVIPSVFDRRVVQEVSRAVAKAARATGVARRQRQDEHDAL